MHIALGNIMIHTLLTGSIGNVMLKKHKEYKQTNLLPYKILTCFVLNIAFYVDFSL